MQNFFSQLDGRIFQFDFSNLLSFDYLFATNPDATIYLEWLTVIGFVSLLIGIFLGFFFRRLKFLDGVRRVLVKNFGRRHLVMSLIFLVLLFARSQRLSFVSMRIWFVVLAILMLANLVYLGYWLYKKAPRKGETIPQVDSSEYQKYLPKKRK